MKLILFFTTAMLSLNLSAKVLYLQESDLKNYLNSSTPGWDEIGLQLKQSKLNLLTETNKYQLELNASGSYSKTKETALVPGGSIFSPQEIFSFGLTKPLPYGLELNANASYSKQDFVGFTGKAYQNRSQFIYELNASIDLWKNLFGKLDRANLKEQQLAFKIASAKKEIESNQYYTSLRNLYWHLVANKEAKKITTQLLNTANQQVKLTKKKLKRSVSDKGELARYKAQVTARKGELIYLDYQYQQLIKKLKIMIPELSEKDIKLKEVNLDASAMDIFQCIQSISSLSEVPFDGTSFDEIAMLTQSQFDESLKNAQSLDQIDLSLSAGITSTGTGQGFSGSYDEQADNDRLGHSLALNFTMPIGGSVKDTRKVTETINRRRATNMTTKYLNQVKVIHNQTRADFEFLRRAMIEQKETSKNLDIRLKQQKKKFKQARVSSSDLIREQEDYLRSELSVIDTNLKIIETLMNYFTVFNEYQCAFKR